MNSYVTTEAMNNGGYSNLYYIEVNTRLSKVEKTIEENNISDVMAKMLIVEELNNIRKDLLNGILKIHN